MEAEKPSDNVPEPVTALVPFGIISALNRILDRARKRQVTVCLIPVPNNQGGGWQATLGGETTGSYREAIDAVFALDKMTS